MVPGEQARNPPTHPRLQRGRLPCDPRAARRYSKPCRLARDYATQILASDADPSLRRAFAPADPANNGPVSNGIEHPRLMHAETQHGTHFRANGEVPLVRRDM